jgi:hypothetical protein
VTWSITAAGEIKDIAGKALEDLERELFDAIGPVLSRFGAYASNFAGHHITGAPHQTTSDAAAPSGQDTSAAEPVTTTAPDPAETGTPFAAGGIIQPGDSTDDTDAQALDTTTYLPAPPTAAEPDPAADPAPGTGAAATT